MTLPFVPQPAPERPVSALAARYLHTYRGKPRKAAAAIVRARAQAQEFRQQGDRESAEAWEEVGDALAAGLTGTGRCSVCGRKLEDRQSIARGIGPDCWGRRA